MAANEIIRIAIKGNAKRKRLRNYIGINKFNSKNIALPMFLILTFCCRD